MSNITIEGSGGLILATSNLTFYVATTGSDTNPGTIGQPFLTIQHALDVVALYNYQSLYFPTINVAAGTYSGQLVLPLLIDVFPDNYLGGCLTGAGVTSILSDTGTFYCLTVPQSACWSVSDFTLEGTYGGIVVNPGAILNLGLITWGGSFANEGLHCWPLGIVIATNSFFETTASTMGIWIMAHGFVDFNTSSLIFGNPITFSKAVMGADSSTSFIAFVNASFTNGANVTISGGGACLGLTNSGFFEIGTGGATVDGVALTRYNFPGHASAAVSIDAFSIFEPDLTTNKNLFAGTGGNSITSGTNNVIIGGWPGSATTNNVFATSDNNGNLLLEYGEAIAGQYTFHQPLANADGGFALQPNGGGTSWVLGTSHTTNSFYLLDITSGTFYIPFTAGYTIFGYAEDVVVGWGGSATEASLTLDTAFSRISDGVLGLGNGAAGDTSGSLQLTDLYTNDAAFIIRCKTTLTNGAGAGLGTLTNAPSAGNPTKWIGIDDNGVTRHIPAW